MALPGVGRGQSPLPPVSLAASEMQRLAGAKETMDGPFPGVLITPAGARNDVDSRGGPPFHALVLAYAGEGGSGASAPVVYARRFAVHAPDADGLPLARRVARMLLLLLGENRARLRYRPPANEPTVEVWLTRQAGNGLSADIGGEQFRDQIYLYNVYADRAPTEWAREVAHEYGHYALPGISGFTAPEAWANGVLGERLFLKWLRDDLRAGKLRPEDLPFVTPGELDAYLERQVTPLIRRVAREGVGGSQLTRRDAGGMDT